MSERNDGKDWEKTIGEACKAHDLYAINPNNIGQRAFGEAAKNMRQAERGFDRLVCYRGFWVMVEAKDCQEYRLQRKALKPSEEEALYATTRAGGLAVVAIRQRTPAGVRAWVCHYADLVQRMRDLGQSQLEFRAVPEFFVPLRFAKVGRGRKLHPDLPTAFDALRAQGPPYPYHLDPEQELKTRAKRKAQREALKAKEAVCC